MMGQLAVSDHGSQAQTAIDPNLNFIQWQAVDIHEAGRCLHVELHEIEQRSAPGDKNRIGLAYSIQRFALAAGLGKSKWNHGRLSLRAFARRLYRSQNVGISAAAADVAAHAFTHVVIGLAAWLIEQCSG